jgi:hypothetical protein
MIGAQTSGITISATGGVCNIAIGYRPDVLHMDDYITPRIFAREVSKVRLFEYILTT